MVPKGWSLVSLNQACGRIIDCEHKTAPYVEVSEYAVVTTNSIKNGVLLNKELRYTTREGYQEWIQRGAPSFGDILFTREAPAGESCMVPKNMHVCMGQRMVLLRPDRKKADPRYLSAYLISQQTKTNIHRLSIGTTVSRINIHDIKRLPCLLPPVTEQNRIADILSTWDEAIATVENLIANSRTQKRVLMQQLLSGTKRLPGFHNPWQEVRFNRVFERVTRKNDIGNGNVLTISGQDGLVSQVDYFNKSVASDDLSGYTLLEKGEFAYNKSYSKGYPMGAIKPLMRYERGVVSSLYICFRLKDDRPSSKEFFRHYFEAGLFNREIYAIAQEGARNHGLLNVSVTDFFNTKLHIPEPAEKEAIEKVINTAEQELHNFEAQLDSLQSQKKALMQQLLTGKRRVKIDAAEARRA